MRHNPEGQARVTLCIVRVNKVSSGSCPLTKDRDFRMVNMKEIPARLYGVLHSLPDIRSRTQSNDLAVKGMYVYVTYCAQLLSHSPISRRHKLTIMKLLFL